MNTIKGRGAFCALVAAWGASVCLGEPIGTGFTYQGRLTHAGVTINGQADFLVRVYDAAEGGTPIGDMLSFEGVEVANGVFTLALDLPEGTFNGEARWLEFAVRTPDDVGEFTPLTPRQPVTPSPYATHAAAAGFAERVEGLFTDDSGTLVIGATDNRPGNIYVEDVAPEFCLDTRSASSGANATIRFRHLGESKGNITWMAEDELLMLHSGDVGGPFLMLNGVTGNMSIGSFIEADASLQIQSGQDVTPGSVDAYLQLGLADSANVAFDNNEIMARTRGEASALYLNHEGGDVRIGAGSGGSTHLAVNTDSSGPFTLMVNGDAAKPGGGSWSNFSDIRLKHDVEPLPAGTLDRVLLLRGYSFEYDDDAIKHRLALPGRQIGLIAQEVEKVFPDWVEEDEEGYKYVTERGVMALLVEALRELRAESVAADQAQNALIDLQREEIERLKTMNTELSARVAHLLWRWGSR